MRLTSPVGCMRMLYTMDLLRVRLKCRRGRGCGEREGSRCIQGVVVGSSRAAVMVWVKTLGSTRGIRRVEMHRGSEAAGRGMSAPRSSTPVAGAEVG